MATAIQPSFSPQHGTPNFNFHVEFASGSIRFSPALGKSFFDEANAELVVINSTDFYRFPFNSSHSTSTSNSTSQTTQQHQEPKKYTSLSSLNVNQTVMAKFSLDHKWFSLQTGPSQVEFFHLESPFRFWQPSKRSKDQILGYYWTFGSENLFYVTQQGIELYQTVPKSKNLKLLKDFRQQINWYTYSHKNRVLLAATGGTSLQGFYFRTNTVNKIPKFDVEPVGRNEPLQQRDIIIAQLYSKLYCLHNNTKKHEIVLYKLSRDSVSPTIRLNLLMVMNYIHVVDDIIVVHTVDSKIAMLYDIRSKPEDVQFPVVAPLPLAPLKTESGDTIEYYGREWMFYSPNYIVDTGNGYVWEVDVNLEAISYSFSDKSKLVDFLLRRSNSKELLLKVIRTLVEDTERLTTLSAIFDQLNTVLGSTPELRAGEQDTHVSRTAGMNAGPGSAPGNRRSMRTSTGGLLTEPPVSVPTSVSSSMLPFENLYASLGLSSTSSDGVRPDDFMVGPGGSLPSSIGASSSGHPPALGASGVHYSVSAPSLASSSFFSSSQFSAPTQGDVSSKPPRRSNEGYQIIDQVDLYVNVFAPLDDSAVSQVIQPEKEYKYLVATLTEYIRSLNSHLIHVKHFLYELMISLLVRNKRFYQLHQFLQYHVVSDSVPVAFQLLSLEGVYAPAYQLALDMLKRLYSPGQIVEVLLSRNQVLAALRVFRANKDIPKIPASRFLEVAVALGDNTLFFTVFKFFEARKEITPDCKRFIDSFNKTFYSEFLGGNGNGTGTGNANANGNGNGNNNPLS